MFAEILKTIRKNYSDNDHDLALSIFATIIYELESSYIIQQMDSEELGSLIAEFKEDWFNSK